MAQPKPMKLTLVDHDGVIIDSWQIAFEESEEGILENFVWEDDNDYYLDPNHLEDPDDYRHDTEEMGEDIVAAIRRHLKSQPEKKEENNG